MYDDEIEKGVLYYLIFENEEYDLEENDFANERHKQIIKAINILKKQSEPINLINIQKIIKRKGVIEYLSNLGEYVRGTTFNNLYNSLIELSKKRKISEIINKYNLEVQETEDTDILSQKIIAELTKTVERNLKEKTFLEQVIETIDEIEKTFNEEEDYKLYYGLNSVDRMLYGLHKQEVTIVGARPRSWKNNICITNSTKNCRKRCSSSYNKPRNGR